MGNFTAVQDVGRSQEPLSIRTPEDVIEVFSWNLFEVSLGQVISKRLTVRVLRRSRCKASRIADEDMLVPETAWLHDLIVA